MLSWSKESFLEQVRKTDGCWYWQVAGPNGEMHDATSTDKKYGCFLQYGPCAFQGYTYPAHRIAWLLWKGPIRPKYFICHTCDNPVCVNPDHLFMGTHQDNMRDMVRKGRHGKSRKEQAS